MPRSNSPSCGARSLMSSALAHGSPARITASAGIVSPPRRRTLKPPPLGAPRPCTSQLVRTLRSALFARPMGRLCRPRGKEHSLPPRPDGPPARASLRLARIPLKSEPCSRSSAASLGKAAGRERSRASPAKTPSTIGAISRSAAWEPMRRRAKSQTLSSSELRRAPMKGSLARRSMPESPRMPERAKRSGCACTSRMRPPRTMKRCSAASAASTRSAVSPAASIRRRMTGWSP